MTRAAGLPPSNGMFKRSCILLDIGFPLRLVLLLLVLELMVSVGVVIRDSTNSSGNPSVFAMMLLLLLSISTTNNDTSVVLFSLKREQTKMNVKMIDAEMDVNRLGRRTGGQNLFFFIFWMFWFQLIDSCHNSP